MGDWNLKKYLLLVCLEVARMDFATAMCHGTWSTLPFSCPSFKLRYVIGMLTQASIKVIFSFTCIISALANTTSTNEFYPSIA